VYTDLQVESGSSGDDSYSNEENEGADGSPGSEENNYVTLESVTPTYIPVSDGNGGSTPYPESEQVRVSLIHCILSPECVLHKFCLHLCQRREK